MLSYIIIINPMMSFTPRLPRKDGHCLIERKRRAVRSDIGVCGGEFVEDVVLSFTRTLYINE